MILYELVQECMGLMTILNEVLCGKNSQGCTPGGIRHGVFLGISIPSNIRVRDLVVRLRTIRKSEDLRTTKFAVLQQDS